MSVYDDILAELREINRQLRILVMVVADSEGRDLKEFSKLPAKGNYVPPDPSPTSAG